MSSITFIIEQDDTDGGYTAQAHWRQGNRDIITEADNRDDLLRNIREAIHCAFDENENRPTVVHLHYVRDEVMAL